MKKHDDQMKKEIFNRYRAGEKVISISEDVGIAKSTLYDWIRKAKAELAEQQHIYEKNKALDPREYYKLICNDLCQEAKCLKQRSPRY